MSGGRQNEGSQQAPFPRQNHSRSSRLWGIADRRAIGGRGTREPRGIFSLPSTPRLRAFLDAQVPLPASQSPVTPIASTFNSAMHAAPAMPWLDRLRMAT